VFTYVMTLQCNDQPGIVRATTSAIVAVNGNILENDQYTDPVTQQFCMRTRFETEDANVDRVRDTLIQGLGSFQPAITLRNENEHRRAVIMVSKFDHCLSDLLYRYEQGDLPLDITAIVSNHPDCAPLAARYKIPYYEIPVTPATKEAAENELRVLIEETKSDFVILARYMQVLSEGFCADYVGRIINIHHSFLPGFKGARPYHQAYERGVKLIGASAHFVTSDLDEGPIIEQDVVRVSHARVASELVALGRDIERTVLAKAVRLVAEDRVAIVGKRTVIFWQ
jgi:formyltetrahydrofolate deformylase